MDVMSLMAWYPLISDMHNQGVGDADLSTTSTPTFDSGIIGGALSDGGASSWTAEQTAKILNNSEITIAFWICPLNTSGGQIFGTNGMSANNNRKFAIFQYPTGNDLHLSWQNDTASQTFIGGAWSGVFPTNQWTHCCVTYKNPTATIYINGVESYHVTGISNSSSFAYSTQVVHANNNRKICDYRIYNHCLSPREVSELSKALVLHYPMTGGGRSGDNLVIDSQNLYTGSSVSTKYIGCRGGNRQLRDDGFYESKCTGLWQGLSTWSNAQNFAVGDIITYSFYTYISGSAHGISFYPMMYNSAGTRDTTTKLPISVDGSSFESGNARGIGTISSTTPEFHYVTFEWNSAVKSIIDNGGRIELSIQASSGSWTDSYICFFKPKLEKGSKPTPWMPNSADTSYITMGYNDTIEYDTSGYLHNGTINGSVSYSSDTARYSVSTEFSKAGYINVPSFNVDTSAFTLNFWVKMKTATSQHFVLGTFTSWTGNGIGIYRDTNAVNYQCLIRSAGESTYKSFVLGLSTDSWYMLTLTYDGTNYKGYLNGILKQNATYGSGGVVSNPVFMVGNSKFNSTPASENEEAFVSDVRFYATCLTAEDIQKLYNTSASLANNGTLMAYEFTEM